MRLQMQKNIISWQVIINLYGRKFAEFTFHFFIFFITVFLFKKLILQKTILYNIENLAFIYANVFKCSQSLLLLFL